MARAPTDRHPADQSSDDYVVWLLAEGIAMIDLDLTPEGRYLLAERNPLPTSDKTPTRDPG